VRLRQQQLGNALGQRARCVPAFADPGHGASSGKRATKHSTPTKKVGRTPIGDHRSSG
jgi:hypothetical protein